MDEDTFIASFAFNRGREDYAQGMHANPFTDATARNDYEAGWDSAAEDDNEDLRNLLKG